MVNIVVKEKEMKDLREEIHEAMHNMELLQQVLHVDVVSLKSTDTKGSTARKIETNSIVFHPSDSGDNSEHRGHHERERNSEIGQRTDTEGLLTNFHQQLSSYSESFKGKVLVDVKNLSSLATEISQMRENLPKILNKDIISALPRVQELQAVVDERESGFERALVERDQWKQRCENVTKDFQREKEESLKLRCEIQDLTQQLTQQSEYCSGMGVACCTLLWRVSRCEESIEAILVGSKVNEFFSVVANTIESYLAAYTEETPSENSQESQFILSLCGVITNIAASAVGREELVKNEFGRCLIDTFIASISFDSHKKETAKMRNLILMSLYNLSINQKGLKYIATKSGIMSILSWLVQSDSDVDIRQNSLRLIQSLITDENNTKSLHELQETLPVETMRQLTSDPNKDIRALALEIVMDMESERMQDQ